MRSIDNRVSSVVPTSHRLVHNLWVCVAVIGALFQEADAAEKLSSQQIEEIERLGEKALSADRLPALSIAVAKGDRMWSAAFGKADLEQNVTAGPRSMFRTGSVVKWMTATAVMRLAEYGKLDMDAPIQNYCPQFPQKQWTVTSRLLLSHLSGMRHYHGANGEPRGTEAERKKLELLIERERSTQYTRFTDVIRPLDGFKDDPLIFQPGTRFNYSSLGYRLLACVIEGASSMSYRTVMQSLIFDASGMKSIVEDDALRIIPNRVAGYARDEKGALLRAPFRDVSENLPAGGHLSRSEDLARFAIAFNTGKLVQPSTVALMIERPKLFDGSDVPEARAFFGQGPGYYYGLGIFVGRSSSGEPVLVHTGSQPGAFTELMLLPKSNIAVAVMTNMSGWTGSHLLAKKIAEIVGAGARTSPRIEP